MRKLLAALLVALAALLVGSISQTSAIDYSVSLTCSDGTQFTAALDAAEAAKLAEAVTAINTYPAGLPPVTCAILQTPINGGAQAAGGPSHDFAVGGGQWKINSATANCEFTNFNMTAHIDTQTGEVRGHFNLRFNQDQMQGCTNPPSGDLTAAVVCLTMSNDVAHMEVVVERSSGTFAANGAFDAGSHLFVRADEATGNNPDKLRVNIMSSCSNASNSAGNQIEHGNINIHVAESDGDKFSDRVEYRAGTDPWAKCPQGPMHNAWPADVNNDGFSDGTDITILAGSFGKTVPPAPARYNIAPDPPDGFVDGTDITAIAGQFGRPC